MMSHVPAHTPLAILAVEDNAADLYLLRRGLDAPGLPYTLHVIEDGTQALDYFDQLAQHTHVRCPDIVLLDLHLPGCPGTVLLQRFKTIARGASTPVVLMTAASIRQRGRQHWR
jgi:CheY-like chemotaxis protein